MKGLWKDQKFHDTDGNIWSETFDERYPAKRTFSDGHGRYAYPFEMEELKNPTEDIKFIEFKLYEEKTERIDHNEFIPLCQRMDVRNEYHLTAVHMAAIRRGVIGNTPFSISGLNGVCCKGTEIYQSLYNVILDYIGPYSVCVTNRGSGALTKTKGIYRVSIKPGNILVLPP